MKYFKNLVAIFAIISVLVGCSGGDDIIQGSLDGLTNNLTDGMDNKYTTLSPIEITIPDNGVVTLMLHVSKSKTIKKLTVATYAKHPKISDLNIYLLSPSGTSVTLMEAQGGDNKLKGVIGFRDDALKSVDEFREDVIVYKPKEPLESFKGENSSGEWKLFIEDTKSGNSGTTTGFSLWFDFD